MACPYTSLRKISSKLVKRLWWYRDVTLFQNGGFRHLWFSKIQILNGWYYSETKSVSSCQIPSGSVNSLLRYGDFSFFQDNGRLQYWILKIAILNVLWCEECPCASPNQILSKSVKRLWTYRNLTVFKSGRWHHLGFSKNQIFNG